MKYQVSQPPEVLENLRKVAVRMSASIELKSDRTAIGQFRLQDGRVCYFLPSSLDINPVGAAALARDKDSASCFMSRMGYSVVESKAFILPSTSARERNRMIDKAYSYAMCLKLPVITKPNSSSRGRGVVLAHTKSEFCSGIRDIFKYDNVALVQRQAIGRDYRIVVLDGTVITACERRPLFVIGDGRSTIEDLLRKKQEAFEKIGRPSRINSRNSNTKKVLKRKRMTLESVLPEGESMILMDTANLMSGGEGIDVTASLHPSIAQTAINVTRDMGLYLSSVDFIVDGNIYEKNPFVILEINSAPGLDHFLDLSSTKAKSVEELYFDVMASFFRL